jgi:hypothetical protein
MIGHTGRSIYFILIVILVFMLESSRMGHIQGNSLNSSIIVPFHILSNSSYSNHPNMWSYTLPDSAASFVT